MGGVGRRVMSLSKLIENFRTNLPYGVGVFFVFSVVFGGCSWYVGNYVNDFYSPGFEWERQIPFVPSFAVVYLSAFLLINALILFIDSERTIRQATKALLLQIAIAGIMFILFPAICLYDERVVSGWASTPFNIADTINLSFNQVPSLHVSLACTAAIYLSRERTPIITLFLHTWVFFVALSTLLIHEHHIIDAIAGYGLAFLCVWIFTLNPLWSAITEESAPPSTNRSPLVTLLRRHF